MQRKLKYKTTGYIHWHLEGEAAGRYFKMPTFTRNRVESGFMASKYHGCLTFTSNYLVSSAQDPKTNQYKVLVQDGIFSSQLSCWDEPVAVEIF